LKSVLTAICLILAVTATAFSADSSTPEPPASFLEYLAGMDFEPFYRMELRRRALDEADLFALREYSGLLQHAGLYERAAAFAESVGTLHTDMDAFRGLIRVEGLLSRGLDSRAISVIDSITPSWPARPLLIELQYFKGNALYNLGRYAESRIPLESIEDELESGLRLNILYYLARCEEKLGNIEQAGTLFERVHDAGLGGGTVGLMRCRLRVGDVDAALDVQREALIKGMELPWSEIEELLPIASEAAPELWTSLLRMLAADTTYAPGAATAAELVREAEQGIDVGSYCGAFLQRTVDRDARSGLRFARALSLEDTRAAVDSLAALLDVADRKLAAKCSAALVEMSAGDTAYTVRSDLWIDLVTSYLQEKGGPDELYFWLDLLVGHGLTRAVGAEVDRLRQGLVVGFDDAALFDLAHLLERAGWDKEALALYGEVSASPVASGAAFRSAKKVYIHSLSPARDEDVSAVIEEVAAENPTNLRLAEVFDRRIGDYAKAAEYYGKALAELPPGEERDRVILKRGWAYANAFLAGGSPTYRDRALNAASALAESEFVGPSETLELLKASTDWLELDLFRATEVARSLAARNDLDSRSLYELIRVIYRLYKRGDPQAYGICLDLAGRLVQQFPASELSGAALLSEARAKQAAGDYAGGLESYSACLEAHGGKSLERLGNMGMGDCYAASGGIEEAIDRYDKAGGSPSVTIKSVNCHRIFAFGGRGEVNMRVYAETDISVAARMLSAVSVPAAEGLPAAGSFVDDTVVPGFRDFLEPYRRLLAAYDLAMQGYDGLAVRMLKDSAAGPPEGLSCEILLPAYDPAQGGHTDFYRALGRMLGPVCNDPLGDFAHRFLRAETLCEAETGQPCLDSRDDFAERFPLGASFLNDVDAIRAASLYREMYVGRADAIVDSLFELGARSELLAEAVYRKGVSFLLEKANEEAKQTFLIMMDHFPESRLRPDVYFKLGTSYYFTGIYDSSAIFFRLAAESGKPSLHEDALFNLGLALEESGDVARAGQVFFETALRFPFSVKFQRGLMRSAFCLDENGKPLAAADVYRVLLKYAVEPEARAEAGYWMGESLAKAGRPVEAAVEFMRVGFLYPEEEAWAGTARYRAGMECENAGLDDIAALVYEENVKDFGRDSTWGKASADRLAELAGED
jgi:TolA-binding protein